MGGPVLRLEGRKLPDWIGDCISVETMTLARQAFAAVDAAGPEALDAEAFLALVSRAGRNHGPALLFDAFYGSKLEDGALATVIGHVWTAAEWPERNVDQDTWIEMFDAAGFVQDNQPAPQPSDLLTLYRGAPEGLERRMAWTDDRTVAAWFASRPGAEGIVWTAEVPSHYLLMVDMSTDGRHEREWVIDPRYITIRRAD